MMKKSNKFFDKIEEEVEIFYNDRIVKVWFKAPFLCFFREEDLETKILENTIRTSHFEKIENFVNNLPVHIEKMKFT